jgi:hypothetical protein
MLHALACLLACAPLSLAYPADGARVLAWVEVVGAEGSFPLLADGARGTVERAALLVAADRSGISLRLPRIADAYQLGHVATESDAALAPLRRMAGKGLLLIGTLTRRSDGYWDGTWTSEDHRASGRGPSPIASSPPLERVSLDAAMQAGTELAARVLAGNP